MSKNMVINYVAFEVQKPVTYDRFCKSNLAPRKDLFDCYGKPSHRKMDIYSDWLEWCLDTEGMSIPTVASYNAFMFTIEATYTDPETLNQYIIEITPAHNRVYPVED